MKTAKQFLKSKKLKDTLYNVETDDGSWVKGGLSKLLDEYADSKVKNFSFNLAVSRQVCFCEQHEEYIDNGIRKCSWCGQPIKQTCG